MSRRFLLLAAAVLALALPAPASAIVNGDPAAYPAEVFVGANTDGAGGIDRYCTGTLVGSRQVLTAARCATYGLGVSLPLPGFEVRVGDVDLTAAHVVAVAKNDVNAGYDRTTGADDVAMLTLAAPVDVPLVRVVDTSETAGWAPGRAARVAGWGGDGVFLSDLLRTGVVTRRPDAACARSGFDPSLMLCAASTAAGGDGNPCAGDSGSPLLLPDGPGFALAGVFSGAGCATAAAPGVFARVGSGPLNAWVHARTPEADFGFDHAPRANEPVTLASTSRHPEGAAYFTTFNWDFDQNGFNDGSGRSVTHTFTTAGRHVVGIQASRAGGDKASAYFSFIVGPDPNAAPQLPILTPAPPPTVAKPAAPRLASISSAKRPRVRRGRFRVSVKFAKTAPRGVAVIEVLRGKRVIGVARTRIRRGATKRVSVKLTTRGKRLLRSNSRLTVKVRVRVGRRVLRSKTLTVRR